MSSGRPWEDARGRIEAWATANGVPVEWPNEPFDRGALADQPFLSVDMEADHINPLELGDAAAWIESGGLTVAVLVPKDRGSLGARQMAKNVASLFRGVYGAISYRSASIRSGGAFGQSEDGNFWRLILTVAYDYQDKPASGDTGDAP
jgi:hypothetical protein